MAPAFARFPAKYAPTAMPKIGATNASVGDDIDPMYPPIAATVIASTRPIATAAHSTGGSDLRSAMRASVLNGQSDEGGGKRNRSARPTRIGGGAERVGSL